MASSHIRRCTPDDLPAVHVLLAQTWHATYDRWYGGEKMREITATWHAPERLAEQVDQPGSVFLVAADPDEIVATAFAHDVGESGVEIGRLYVSPSHQNSGIGAALLDTLICAFPSADRFLLDVEPRHAGAIRFYRRHGFRCIVANAGCNPGLDLPHLRMWLMLHPPAGAAGPACPRSR